MGIVAKDTGGGEDLTPVPQGTHLAICNMVVDLGLQETTYMGQLRIKHQVYIRWEIPDERIEYITPDGEKREGPRVIGKTYTLSLGEKANLRKDLEAWRGRAFTPAELEGFDLLNLLGVPCQVTITHKQKEDKTYANVTSLAGWPKGLDKPSGPENAPLKYCADDTADFDTLPEWLQKKIKEQKQPEAGAHFDGDPGPSLNGGGDLDDEIPFAPEWRG